MKKVNLDASRKTFVLLITGTALGFLLCCGIAAVGFSQISSARADMEQKMAQVEDGRQIASRLENSQLDYARSVAQLKYLERSVSTRAYVPTLLKQLERLAKSLNLEVEAVRPVADVSQAPPGTKSASDSKGPKAPYSGQRIDLSLRGYYADGLSFIYRLNKFPKILTVNRVDVAPAIRDGSISFGQKKLLFNLNITAYTLDEPGQSKAPASANAKLGEKDLAKIDTTKPQAPAR